MAPLAISERQMRSLEELIFLMQSRERVSSEEIELMRKNRRPDFLRDTKEQIEQKLSNIRGEANSMEFLTGPFDEVRNFISSQNNNIDFQIETTKNCFLEYFRIGLTPPPYYPFRIAVILRKANLVAVEQRFLEAWVSHFPDDIGGSFTSLLERLEKITKKKAELIGLKRK